MPDTVEELVAREKARKAAQESDPVAAMVAREKARQAATGLPDFVKNFDVGGAPENFGSGAGAAAPGYAGPSPEDVARNQRYNMAASQRRLHPFDAPIGADPGYLETLGRSFGEMGARWGQAIREPFDSRVADVQAKGRRLDERAAAAAGPAPPGGRALPPLEEVTSPLRAGANVTWDAMRTMGAALTGPFSIAEQDLGGGPMTTWHEMSGQAVDRLAPYALPRGSLAESLVPSETQAWTKEAAKTGLELAPFIIGGAGLERGIEPINAELGARAATRGAPDAAALEARAPSPRSLDLRVPPSLPTGEMPYVQPEYRPPLTKALPEVATTQEPLGPPTPPASQYASPLGPPKPPTPYEFRGAPLERAVRKAGFKDVRQAVEAVMAGDENALQTLRPRDLAKLQEIADNIKPRYVGGRLTRESVARATPERIEPPGRVDLGTEPPPEASPTSEASTPKSRQFGAGRGRRSSGGEAAIGEVAKRVAEFVSRYGPEGARLIAEKFDEGLPAPIHQQELERFLVAPQRQEGGGGLPPLSGGAVGSPPELAPPGVGAPPSLAGPPRARSIFDNPSPESGRGNFSPNFIDRSVEQLKDPTEFGPGGEALSNDIQDVQARTRQIRATDAAPFDKAVESLSPFRRKEANASLQAWAEGTKPIPAWANRLVEGFRAAWENYRNTLNKAGVRIVDSEGNVREIAPGRKFPTRPKPESVAALKAENGSGPLTDEFMAANPGKENPFARVESDKPSVVQRKRSAIESFYAGTERAHEYNWPESMQVPNKLDTATYYFDRAAQNAAEHETFGYRYETKNGETIKTEGRLREHLNAIGDRPTVGARTAADRAESIALSILGRNPADSYGPGWKEAAIRGFNKAEGIYSTASKLGFSPVHIFTRASHWPIFVGEVGPAVAGRTIARMVTEFKNAKEAARAKGVLRPGVDEMVRMGEEDSTRFPGRFERGVRVATKVATYLPNKMSQAVEIAAANAADAHIANIQRGLAEGGRSADWATRRMQVLDLAPGDMSAIRSGEISPLLRDKVAQRLADYVNFSADRGNKPAFMSNPRQAWLWRFKGVPLSATRAFLETGIREAGHGNFGPLAGIVASSIALYAGKEGVNKALGRKPDPHAQGLLDSVAKGDAVGAVKNIVKATAIAGTAGTLGEAAAPLVDTGSTLVNSAERIFFPPMFSTVGEGLKRMDYAIQHKGGDKSRFRQEQFWKYMAGEYPQIAKFIRIAKK